VFDILKSATFEAWMQDLRDSEAVARINARIRRLSLGNAGDVKSFSGISEMRIDYGPGYRVYFVKHGKALIVLLCGGDKRTQDKDIKRAVKMAKELKE
jgi:putative addiction module killer protein